MLTRKSPVFLAIAAGLLAGGLLLTAYPAAVLGAGLLILYSVNALAIARPDVRAEIELSTKRVSEDQQLTARLTVENAGRSPLVVDHELSLDPSFERDDASVRGVRVIPAGDEVAWETEIRPRLLGAYAVGPLRIRLSDPSGLRLLEEQLAQPSTVLVEPRLEDLKGAPLQIGEKVNFFGTHEASQPGDGFEFYTLRQWQHGDSMRSINWRASARSEGLIVNQRQRETFISVAIILDATARSHDGLLLRSPFAACARAAASLAAHLIENRDRVQFHILTDRLQTVHPQTPERQRRTILEEISTTRPTGRARLDHVVKELLPRLSPGQPVVLASSFETDPTVIAAVKDLAARDHQVIALSAPSVWPSQWAEHPAVQVRQAHRALVRDRVRGAGGLFVELEGGRPLPSAFLEAVMG